MNAAQAIDRAKAKKRLGELLGNKARTLEEANELVDILVGYVVQAQTSILDIRDRMATQEGAIETLANMVAPEQDSKLIGFDEPKLVGIKH